MRQAEPLSLLGILPIRFLTPDTTRSVEIRATRAARIAAHFAYSNPQWILPIPRGGIALAEVVNKHFPEARCVEVVKLNNGSTIPADWEHPFQLPVFSHRLQKPVIIATNLPPVDEPVLIIDDTTQHGFTAHDVLCVLRSRLTLVGFGVGKQYYPGTLETIGEYYQIPVFAASYLQR